MPSKEFHEIVEKMKEIYNKKSHDYAKDNDPFSNFKFAAEIVKHYSNPIDQVFASIIAIKLARLSELLNGKEAKNESVNDSFIDLANYSALWGAYYLALADIKIEDNSETLEQLINPYGIAEICSACKLGDLNHQLQHAVTVHGAEVIHSLRQVLYPGRAGKNA